MIRMVFALLALLCVMMPPGAAQAEGFSERAAKLASVKAVRVGATGDRLRIVVDAGRKVEFSTLALKDPSRIVVDLKGAWLSPHVARETVLQSRFASRVRVGQFNADTVRIVVETTVGKDQFAVFPITGGSVPYRVVMDFGQIGTAKNENDGSTLTDGRDDTAAKEKPASEAKPPGDKKEDGNREKPREKDSGEDDGEEALSKGVKLSPGIKGKVIAIDPGHGGEDSGAIGPSGVTEKSITLRIAKAVQEKLKAAGAKVVMTRTADVEVSPKRRQATDIDELQARCDVANKAKADIFISIHTDSFTSREASGTTGYYYTKGTEESKRLAAAIQSGLVAQLRTESRGVKTCNFYVVKHTKMPATLIEVAFVSNPKEEKLMTSKGGVEKAALGILKGLEGFFGK